MKKRFYITLAAILMALLVPAVCVACNDTKKVEYSVTVLSVDEETPLEGVTVSWIGGSKTAGSAITNAQGEATASLPAGVYSVRLFGYPAGYTYTQVRVTESMRKVTLALEVQQQEYTVSVVDKTGLPAVGVTAVWTDGDQIVGTATTDENGKAECSIAHGNYYVALSTLPAGNVCNEILRTTGENRSLQVNLTDGTATQYRITVRSEGGLLFKAQPVVVFNVNEDVVGAAKTDSYGVVEFALTAANCKARATALQKGYSAQDLNLSSAGDSELVLKSAVLTEEPAADTRYVIGDIIHDYTFTTPYQINGEYKEYKISELLKTKQAVLINNWGTKCSYCVQEMPAMEQAYQKYKDSIEILAVSNYSGGDSDQQVSDYYKRNGYTFPMMRDKNGLAAKFGIEGWPTTVVIDRYGAVARIEEGGVPDAELWERMITKYIGNDYVQTFTPGADKSDSIVSEAAKPDVTVPADHYEKMAQAVNRTDTFPQGASVVWRGETENEYAWPFLFGKVDGVSEGDETLLYASNTGKHNSMSILYAKVDMQPGYVFTFDYYAQTQANDVLFIVWDGMIIREISGDSEGWKTCTVYTELTAGKHDFAMMYRKDATGNVGKDNVFLRNIRFMTIGDISEPTDMMRSAAYGIPEQGDERFPYYATVTEESDGYYHVKTSELQNPALAGVDDSPLLLVNLLSVTNWNVEHSIRDFVYAEDENSGGYKYNFELSVNGGAVKDYRDVFIKYLQVATWSDIPNYVPVDKELHDLLVAFTKSISGAKAHDDEWLELCYFYSHYGSGDFVGNPILGLTEKTALPASLEGRTTADVTRPIYPVSSTIYTFTPQTSGVYRMQSFIPDSVAEQKQAQMCLYDDATSSNKPLAESSAERFYRGGVNLQNFVVYRYLEAGHKYYLQLALLMSETGTYEFEVAYVGNAHTELTPCSLTLFELAPSGALLLAGAVEYELEQNSGYYRVKNKDGSLGSYIYLDYKYVTALTNYSITALLDQKLRDPHAREWLDYYVFDFRYRIAYETQGEGDEAVINYYPKYPLTGSQYKDYTQILKDYFADPANAGEEDGLVKVNEQLKTILNLFLEVRVNMMMDGVVDEVHDNEYLQFCWYYRTYDSENP